MAFSPKFVCFFFVVISLLSSLEINARESRFFSQVTRNNPNKDVEFVHLNKQENQQQPAFIPQTTETGYGLYGHETGLNPPSSTSSPLYNMDQNSKFDNFYSQNKYDESNFNNNKYDESNFNNNKYDESNFNNNKYDESNFNNNNKYDESNFNNKYDESNFNFNNKNKYDESNFNNNNKDNNDEFFKYDNNKNTNENEDEKNYAPELKGLSGSSKYLSNNNNNNNYGYNGGVEKQGMSDTRFLENGKYFYDVEAEKNFDANNNNYMSYANNYNTNGYYGNNYEYYNNNNQKNGNGMQGYHNKVQEDEFDFDDQP